MIYTLLADLVVALHVFYVSYVLLGELIILLGLACRWTWVRNRWFRLTHLAAILIVVFETLAGIACPLTVWENQLRGMAGQTVTEGTFVGRCMHGLLFHGPPGAFNTAYIIFGLVVLATLVLAPPRWRTMGRPEALPS